MRQKFRVGLVLYMLLLVTVMMPHRANAQKAMLPHAAPSLEVTYAYTHTNGPPGRCGCIGLNGGGAQFVLPLRATRFSLEGQFSAANAGSLGTQGYDLKLFTYTAGARYSPRWKYSLFEPYGEILIGGVHAGGTYAKTTGLGSAFAATGGGGLNLRLRHRLGIKLFQADYVTNTFLNGDTDHQNNFRLSTGIVFSFRH